MNLVLHNNQLTWGNVILPCVWGRGGISPSKVEGDGTTPVGQFPFRRVFYRADRIPRPETTLPLQALRPQDGWCDDPEDPLYNQYIARPYSGRHEGLWREDSLYDLILIVGYNDDPIVKGKGSAVFVHLRRPEGESTEGCVALDLWDLLMVVKEGTLHSSLIVKL